MYDQAIGDIAFGDSLKLRMDTVDVDIELRTLLRLLDAGVDHAGNMPDLTQHQVGVGKVGRQTPATNLQIDRCRRAEIENLADDVRRQERKRDARKLARQFFA